MGDIPKAVAYTWNIFFQLDCLVRPKWERKYLALQRLDVLGWVGIQGHLPLITGEGEGRWIKELYEQDWEEECFNQRLK